MNKSGFISINRIAENSRLRAVSATRPRRRGDRIAALFAAVHESPCGTFRTSRDVRLESAMRAKADIGPGDREARR